MHVVRIELAARRLWFWALGVACAWCAIAIALTGRWEDSRLMGSVWVAIPTIYVGSIVAAASADLTHARRTPGMASLVASAAQPRWRARLAHAIAGWSLIVLGPALAALGVVGGISMVNGATGTWSWGYWINAIGFLTAIFATGRLCGEVISSAAFAPAAAFVIGLGAGLYIKPAPAANDPWQMPSVAYSLTTWALALILLAAACAAALDVRYLQARGYVARGATAVLAGGAMVVASFLMNTDIQVPRSAHDELCETTHAGTQVCVWPDHAEYLPLVLEQAGRFDSIIAALDWAPKRWVVREPGLADPDETAELVGIEPWAKGPGLWLVAESFSYALSPRCVRDHSADEYSLDELRFIIRSASDSLTDYLYGGTRPSEIEVVGADEVSTRASIAAREAAELDDDARRAWIIGAYNKYWEYCQK